MHFGMRRCQLGSCTPAVYVSECALMLERDFHGCNCDGESHLSDASLNVCICGYGFVLLALNFFIGVAEEEKYYLIGYLAE